MCMLKLQCETFYEMNFTTLKCYFEKIAVGEENSKRKVTVNKLFFELWIFQKFLSFYPICSQI